MKLNFILIITTLLTVFPDNTSGYNKKQPDGYANHQKEDASNLQDNTTDLSIQDIDAHYTRPLALKTNLLFDAATLINVEVEVPVAPRWSIAGEWLFPWWVWESKQHALQVLSGNLEARYWFKPNYGKQASSLAHHNPMTGWFAGAFGGGGVYDIEWDKEGYQGDFFFSTGISAGYVASLSRNLNMEFSVGAGLLQTRYKKYNAVRDENNEWHLIKEHPGNYTWIGPLKAKISLVWYPHFKKRNGHRR